MRRAGIFLLAFIAVVAMTGPVSAQPKVTISGFVDTMTTYTRNVSNVDNNFTRSSDTEWYSRIRVRPDITAEVGTTKFVLGMEIDEVFGQTGNSGAGTSLGGTATGAAGTQGSFPQRFGSSAGWQLNTDTMGVIEIKWAYTEFDMPIIPIPTRFRIGAQPWEAQYKLAVLANGDFAGIHMTNQWNPMIKTNFTYAQIEEQSTGVGDAFIRGDDFAIITSIEVTPFKGLDIRPIFSYANFQGVTSGASRLAKGGVGAGAANFPTGNTGLNPAGVGACAVPVGGTAGAPTGGTGCFSSSAIEDRYTVGVDARWRFGPFSLDPTVFYQFGSRDQVVPLQNGMVNGNFNTLKLDAWFVDIRGGWQAGPLLLEAAGVYTTGNRASDRIDLNASRIKYYQPISNDSSYFATWGELWALNIDYFNQVHYTNGGLSPGISIGYDKYGLIRFGTKASYALTPAFTVRAAFNAQWTAEGVDTQTSTINAAGVSPCTAGNPTVAALNFPGAVAANGQAACTPTGNASYLGSEINVGFVWRFVPNVAFDAVYAHMWAGNALASPTALDANTGVARNNRNPKDADMLVARIRYSF
jgi:hypothetical protein